MTLIASYISPLRNRSPKTSEDLRPPRRACKETPPFPPRLPNFSSHCCLFTLVRWNYPTEIPKCLHPPWNAVLRPEFRSGYLPGGSGINMAALTLRYSLAHCCDKVSCSQCLLWDEHITLFILWMWYKKHLISTEFLASSNNHCNEISKWE